MDENSWKGLLTSALVLLDDLAERGFGAPDLTLGGGTVLMMRYRHRLSKDIDLFMHDAQWLGLLTPRLNDRAAALARDYSEQANSLKLAFADGDVDFIVAGDVTGVRPSATLDFDGRRIALESSEEILAKKLYFRAALLKPRDVFDLVATHQVDPAAAERAIKASSPRRVQQLRRLGSLERVPADELGKDILCLGEFDALLHSLISTATALLETMT
ncbi:MAG: nucleotidyl transferase AbiEii/AbiGii toxin family protein [Roseiarcus sp.]